MLYFTTMNTKIYTLKRVTLVTKPMISHEWEKNRKVLTWLLCELF